MQEQQRAVAANDDTEQGRRVREAGRAHGEHGGARRAWAGVTASAAGHVAAPDWLRARWRFRPAALDASARGEEFF